MKHRNSPASLTVIAGFILATGTAAVRAQDPGPYTLHVYTNLVQVPTLVLSSDKRPLPPMRREQFSISLDSGPAFHPTKMRIEGDDPISIAVLLNVSGTQDMVKSFVKAFPKVVAQSLHPQDRVSIFAIDCGLFSSVIDIPADANAVTTALAAALATPGLHGQKLRPACRSSLHLWDAVVQLTNSLDNFPGRRVILAVSQGHDTHSDTKFTEAKIYAGSKSVAVFGLRDWDEFVRREETPTSMHVFGSIGYNGDEDLFDEMCESNGGLALTVFRDEVLKTLRNFFTMLRGRYIIEYPHPDHGSPGLHSILIWTPEFRSFIAATGVAAALPDPAVLADPATVHASPSPAKYGTRHPLSPKQ